jgi:CpeT/CpcT family (DUF1001)
LSKSLDDNNSLESSNDSGTSDNDNGKGLHAAMVHGSASLDSPMLPGQKIPVHDQLSLSWIHDRGYNPDTTDCIYGNQRGIPYRMQRVTTIQCRPRV